MKILQVIPSLFIGGAERFVVDLCNEFIEQNDVYLLTFNVQKNSFLRNILDSRVSFKKIEKRRGFDYRIFWKIFIYIKSIHPDIIHTHVNAFNYLWVFKLIFPKIKFIHTVHNDADKEFKGKIELMVRKIFLKKRFILPVTISPSSRINFIDFYGFIPPLITNGRPEITPTDKYNLVKREIESIKQEGSFVLVNIGRIIQQKNQVMLVDAVNELNNQGFNVVLYIIGSIRERGKKEFTEIVSKQTTSIKLIGEKSNPGDYLLNADGFCLSSAWEGMPITFIEALSAKCIPVCTPVGGLVDYVEDGVNGFISEDLSINSYINSIKNLLKSSHKDKIKVAAYQTYQNYFSMKNCANKYLDLFKEISSK